MNRKIIVKKALIAFSLSASILLGPLTLKDSVASPKSISEQNVPQISEEQQIEEYIENRDNIVKEFNALTKRFYTKATEWLDELKNGRITTEEYYELLVPESKYLSDQHSKILMQFDALMPPSLKLVKRHLLTAKGFKEGIEADKSVIIKDFEAEKKHRSRSREYFMKCGYDLERYPAW